MEPIKVEGRTAEEWMALAIQLEGDNLHQSAAKALENAEACERAEVERKAAGSK